MIFCIIADNFLKCKPFHWLNSAIFRLFFHKQRVAEKPTTLLSKNHCLTSVSMQAYHMYYTQGYSFILSLKCALTVLCPAELVHVLSGVSAPCVLSVLLPFVHVTFDFIRYYGYGSSLSHYHIRKPSLRKS
ncbi:hypothetical protein UYO_2335 [Lachnospiraceae bacterium JC7]|nr:hypothetical protein UYO_2335 [Lachnospiraceae bacterium JC7]